jgi:inorganic pyrophosphatase
MANKKDIEIDVFIEISKNSSIKYEYDMVNKALRCDRILHTPFKYFFNYGFIPNTMSGDGDPLDVIVLMEEELIPGCYVKCKILGCLDTSDDDGNDPKVIACPINKISPSYKDLNNLEQLSEHLQKKLSYFFSHYKDLENKHVKINGFLTKEKAIEIYELSKINFKKFKNSIITSTSNNTNITNNNELCFCETLDTM